MNPKYLHKVLLFAIVSLALQVHAGTVSGTISLPTSGQGIANGTLTFSLSQAAVLSGTATLATNPVSCYTDANGTVVGVPNPLVTPAPSQNLGSGTLPAGTYFYRITYFNGSGESTASPESSFATTGTGTLIIAAPPARSGATGYNVYIASAAGAETRQGSVTGFASNYSQVSALVSGAALPVSNTSVCSLFFNDQLTPSFTGYNVNLVNAAGAQVSGFPQKWYLSGGANGTVNVSLGTPLYSGIVVYPQAIVSTPIANAQQSINGPLGLNGFNLLNLGAIVANSLNPAGSGLVRAASTDLLSCMRSVANSADVCLSDSGAAATSTGNKADLLKWSGGGAQFASYVDQSAAPAQSGVLATGNNVCAVASRNAAGSGDVCAVQVDNTNSDVLPATKMLSLSLNGDTASTANPRMLVSCYIRSNLAGLAYCETFLDKAITITRVTVSMPTAPVGCTTSPVAGVNGGASATVTLANGLFQDDSTFSVNLAAGAAFNIGLATAGAGCATAPADMSVVVQYKMQ